MPVRQRRGGEIGSVSEVVVEVGLEVDLGKSGVGAATLVAHSAGTGVTGGASGVATARAEGEGMKLGATCALVLRLHAASSSLVVGGLPSSTVRPNCSVWAAVAGPIMNSREVSPVGDGVEGSV